MAQVTISLFKTFNFKVELLMGLFYGKSSVQIFPVAVAYLLLRECVYITFCIFVMLPGS